MPVDFPISVASSFISGTVKRLSQRQDFPYSDLDDASGGSVSRVSSVSNKIDLLSDSQKGKFNLKRLAIRSISLPLLCFSTMNDITR